MNTRYVIQWKSKVNGRRGRGTKLFEQAEAEDLVRELNREYPEIEHEMVAVASPESAPTPPQSSPPSNPIPLLSPT